MAICNVLAFLVKEFFLRWLLITIIVSLQTTYHAEVVHKEWMLIDVLKDAELALVKRELKAILEVEMWI